MIDPNTIAIPPTPTTSSTPQEWGTYASIVRALAEFQLAAAAEKQANAQLDAVAAVMNPSPMPPHPDDLAARTAHTAAVNALADALKKPEGIAPNVLVDLLRLALTKA